MMAICNSIFNKSLESKIPELPDGNGEVRQFLVEGVIGHVVFLERKYNKSRTKLIMDSLRPEEKRIFPRGRQRTDYSWSSRRTPLYPAFADLAPPARTLLLWMFFLLLFLLVYMFGSAEDFDRGSRWLFLSLFFGVWSTWRLLAVVAGGPAIRHATRPTEDVLEYFEYSPHAEEKDDIDYAFPSRREAAEEERKWRILENTREDFYIPMGLSPLTYTAPMAATRLEETGRESDAESDEEHPVLKLESHRPFRLLVRDSCHLNASGLT
jgi:hypothetical protein